VTVGDEVNVAIGLLVGLGGRGVAVAVGGRGVGEGVSVLTAGWVVTTGVGELHPARKMASKLKCIQCAFRDVVGCIL